jgi:hypothetical protein
MFMRVWPVLTPRPVAPDRLVPVVLEYQLPHLVADLLPVMNEVASLRSAHDFSSLLFQNCDDRLGIGSRSVALTAGDRSE